MPWLDAFFRWFFERHPVSATFVGLHEGDGRLPDVGPEGLERTASEARALLARAGHDEGRAAAVTGGFEWLDRRLAAGALRIRLWELESPHGLANPSSYAGEAVFGMMSLLLSDFAPLGSRIDALAERMRGLPAFLEAAEGNVAVAPRPWTERAIRECRGGLAFLERGVPTLRAQADARGANLDGLAAASAEAASALRRFRAHLERGVADAGEAAVACGPEALQLHVDEAHFLATPAEEIARAARDEMDRVDASTRAEARRLGADDPAALLARLRDRHPPLEGYYARYGETWSAMKALSDRHGLVSWPAAPIRYVPRPAWAREAAPDLYFLFYRSPAAFGRPEVHDYLVTPIDATEPPERRSELLRAHHDEVIKTNHVIHHGGIGHHVQNWHAFRSPSRVGRIAAVDCASRIALPCGGTMAEGWACYATDVMAEVGALDALERFAHDRGRLRMCARAVVDVELHRGRMTLSDAAALYHERAGMAPAAARAEAVKNSMFPGAALMYLVGTDAIHALRGEVAAALGSGFSLRGFHDAFLSYGSVPVALVAREMTARARRGLPLGAHDAPWGIAGAPGRAGSGSDAGAVP